jgi:[ribosomal protein S18]-alanine N-acetyltransferase
MNDIIVCRLMTVDDIDEVLLVENASFPTPWSRDAFENEIIQNHFANYIVLEVNDELVGYGGFWSIVDEAHITNVAISPAYRGKKLGDYLVKNLMELAIELGAEMMTLEVRVSNIVAQNLYKKYGFEEKGIRKGYYSDDGEDALIMWVNLKNDNN